MLRKRWTSQWFAGEEARSRNGVPSLATVDGGDLDLVLVDGIGADI